MCAIEQRSFAINVGAFIRNKRAEAGLTQVQVSELLGMDRYRYRRYESGDHFPKPEHLWLLACLFNCSPAEFYPQIKPIKVKSTEIAVTRIKKIKTISI